MLNNTKTQLKHGILAIAAAMFCASCSNENGFSVSDTNSEQDVLITVPAQSTRTVNDGIYTDWESSDAITVLTLPQDGGCYPSKFRFFSSEDGGKFSGRIEQYGAVNTFYAFYPYSESITSPENFQISVNPAPVQEGNSSTAHLAGTGFPLYGVQTDAPGISSIVIHVANVLSVAKFNVTNTTSAPIVVKSIEFSSTRYLSGPFCADVTADAPVWAPQDGASNRITLTVSNGEPIAAGANAYFYAGIRPNVFPAGSKLKVRITAASGSQDVVFYRLFELVNNTRFDSSRRTEIICRFNADSSQDPWPESESLVPDESQNPGSGEPGDNEDIIPDSDEPFVPDVIYDLENEYLKEYLDAARETYTNYSTTSIVEGYMGDTYVAHDLPNPVSLSWTGNATSVSIFEGTATTGTPVKTMSFSSSTSASVYNLIPGKVYTYLTSNGQSGTFGTSGRRRMIKVSDSESANNARNCRDFGGMLTRSGETLNYGLMYRGANMDDVTQAEKNILLNELGIKLDQDLRNEYKENVSPIGVSFSWYGGYDPNQIYNENGDKMKNSVSDVLNSVIKGEPVYIHCRIGSDRTGHMCLLYAALLGCDLKECDIDYEITSFASKMTQGYRKLNERNEQQFRNKFIKSPYNADQVPEAVQDYVVNTLGIPLETVKKFRKAMGVSETLSAISK